MFIIFYGIHELTPFGSAILSDSPMWFTTALSTDFGQTGFAPVEELLIISRIYLIYPIPNHTALDGVSRPRVWAVALPEHFVFELARPNQEHW